MKKVYVVRHCKAEGQPPRSPLTEEGIKQAEDLVAFFAGIEIEQIISSPFERAIQTIEPLAEKLQLEIKRDPRLEERVLSSEPMEDWYEKLRETFTNPQLKFQGGESSDEAKERIVEVIGDVIKSDVNHSIIVTHGNIMALLLTDYDEQFGFEGWANLSNPDVYVLRFDSEAVITERLWGKE